ncbi:MAG: hypothetical protein M0Z92_09365 [Actinomycetota bacterium]|nr:hypothetical protein [Actinomycetota bacterium]
MIDVSIFSPAFARSYLLSTGNYVINLEAERGGTAGLFFTSTDQIRELARAMTAWADEQDGVER